MSDARFAPEIVTFGCRINSYESQMMREKLSFDTPQKLIIVNSCAVTAEAERQGRQSIRKLARENPGALIVVTGCAAQIAPEKYAAMAEVDVVLGNDEKNNLQDIIEQALAEKRQSKAFVQVSDIHQVKETTPHLLEGFDGRTRAFVQVQQGCDHRCTFCIVPSARGPNRSVAPEHVVAQCQKLTQNGFVEIVLTGVDVASYGGDRNKCDCGSLGELVTTVLEHVPAIGRLRLGSVDPMGVDDALMDVIANNTRFMPHLHLSIQAGDDAVLKKMARRHRRADIFALVDKLRGLRPDIALGADFICGFPTETDEMFEQSCDLVQRCGLTHLHVFPYSIRPGTPAARWPQNPKATSKLRAEKLRELGLQQFAAFLASQVGTQTTVLTEQPTFGHSENYLPVDIDRTQPIGHSVRVRITDTDGHKLSGEILP